MGSRRTMILVGAICIGLIAGLLVMKYVSGIEDRVQGDNEMVEVVVVTADIARGTTYENVLANNQLAIGERRRVDLPADAVLNVEDLKNQVATTDLTANEIVTKNDFAAPGQAGGSQADQLAEGMTAITISTDQVHGVADLIQPGDYVNIIVSITPEEDPGPTLPGEEEAEEDSLCLFAPPAAFPALDLDLEEDGLNYCFTPSAHLYQKVKILAIGQSFGETVIDAEGNTVEQESTGLVTFEVPPGAAQLIATAAEAEGFFYLTLVRQDYEPVAIPYTGVLADLPGESGQTPDDDPTAVEQDEEGEG